MLGVSQILPSQAPSLHVPLHGWYLPWKFLDESSSYQVTGGLEEEGRGGEGGCGGGSNRFNFVCLMPQGGW